MSSATIESATCLACGCLCDDIRLTIENQRIATALHACELGTRWFTSNPQPPQVTCDGKTISLSEAVKQAATILSSAKRPAIFGLTGATNETVREAVGLADRLDAALDLSLSPTARASLTAMSDSGKLTATWGEVRNSAKLVIYFGCDPSQSHPRHLERYIDSANTKTVVIDSQDSATSNSADQFIHIASGSQYEALCALRAAAQNRELSDCAKSTGVDTEVWAALHSLICESQVVAVITGSFVPDPKREDHSLLLEALYSWVRDASQHARLFTLPLGNAGNAKGAIEVVTWQTGYPPPVDFSAGFPQHCPTTLSMETLLSRKVIDAALVIEPAEAFTDNLHQVAMEHLQAIPTIVFTSAPTGIKQPTIEVVVAMPGLQSGGTVHRSDNVALPLRAAMRCDLPTSNELLRQLRKSLED